MRRFFRLLLTTLALSVVFSVGLFVWSIGLAEFRSRALWRQMQHGPGAVVDFTRIGPSDWDRLFIFHPYTPIDSIHQSLGYAWPDAECSDVGGGKAVNLVVFTRAGRVVGWFDHPRYRGDLKELASKVDGYPREQSRFRVFLVNERWLILAPPGW